MPVIELTDGLHRTRRNVHSVEEKGIGVMLSGIYGTNDSKLLTEEYPPGKRGDPTRTRSESFWYGVSQSMADPNADRSEEYPKIVIPHNSPIEVEVDP